MRYVAFLRALNVGGRHVVKMDRLKTLFEDAGFKNVETFIASGNVIFDAGSKKPEAIARAIEKQLHDALGHEVHAFVRTCAELKGIEAHKPFAAKAIESSLAFNVAFLAAPLDAKARKALMALATQLDDFHVNGREIYWLSRARQSESVISNAVFEKTLGCRSTVRGINTIRKMAEKYGS
jgi:uncharacterized protein (DUF1697 family)